MLCLYLINRLVRQQLKLVIHQAAEVFTYYNESEQADY